MADPFVTLAAKTKAFEKAAGSGGALDALVEYFGAAGAALQSELVHRRIKPRIEPDVRRVLESAWSRSGLDKNSKAGHGQLYKAATSGATISASPTGILVTLAAGNGKNFYAWAGAMLFGAVHGPTEKREIRDTVTGKYLGTKFRSVLGAKAKRSIKTAAFKGVEVSERARKRIENPSMLRNGAQEHAYTQRRGVLLGHVHVRAPHDFWAFTPGEEESLVNKYLDYQMEEVNALLRNHRAMRAKVS